MVSMSSLHPPLSGRNTIGRLEQNRVPVSLHFSERLRALDLFLDRRQSLLRPGSRSSHNLQVQVEDGRAESGSTASTRHSPSSVSPDRRSRLSNHSTRFRILNDPDSDLKPTGSSKSTRFSITNNEDGPASPVADSMLLEHRKSLPASVASGPAAYLQERRKSLGSTLASRESSMLQRKSVGVASNASRSSSVALLPPLKSPSRRNLGDGPPRANPLAALSASNRDLLKKYVMSKASFSSPDANPNDDEPGYTASPRAAERVPKWQGEAPERFVSIRGRTITESEILETFVLYCECTSLTRATTGMAPDTLKQFASARKHSKSLQRLTGLAVSLSASLRICWVPNPNGVLYEDFVSAMWQRLLPHEVQFLARTVAQLNLLPSETPVPFKPLTQKEFTLAMELYDLLLTGTLSEEVSGSRVIVKIEQSFPQLTQGSTVLKQMTAVLGTAHTKEISRDKFITFLSVNRASTTPIDLDEWKAILQQGIADLNTALSAPAPSEKDKAAKATKGGGLFERFFRKKSERSMKP